MFNADFYPTPKEVVTYMIGNNDLNKKNVLEPSAGSGNMLNVLIEKGAKVSFCEKEPVLADAIKGKGNFLGHDFLKLTSEEVSHFDFIIMNPPFSADETHILHAFEIAPGNCHIIALCNSRTIWNSRHTRDREKLFDLIGEYGSDEDLGTVFSTAERKTDVEVSLVNLYKPAKEGENEFEGFFSMQEDYLPDSEVQGMIQYDEVTAIVQRYINAVKMFDSVQEKAKQINDVMSVFNSDYREISFVCEQNQKGNINTREEFKKRLQKKAWVYVFSKLNMDKYITRSVRDKINAFCEKQHNVPFTVKNIWKMLEVIVGTRENSFKQVLIEVFEQVTKHHHENRHHVEGWKTNDAWLVNEKFILPCIVEQRSWDKETVHVNTYGGSSLDDFQKALCNLTGSNYNNISDLYTFCRNIDTQWGKWYSWGFFEIKCFKKGTIHCKFQNKEHWELFNRKVAEAKGWQLPETTKHAYRQKKDGVDLFSNASAA